MKSTKIMLCVVASLMATWLFIATITYFLSDLNFKSCFSAGSTIGIMLLIGWVPSIMVGSDLDSKMKS